MRHPLCPTSNVGKANGGCRREVGMARFTKLSVLCLYCFMVYFPYIYIPLYLYDCIVVYTYRMAYTYVFFEISIFTYSQIALLLSIYIACHTAIFIFFYLYFCSRFFGSTSIFYHEPKSHPLGFLLCKVMAALADTKHQSLLSLSGKIFLQQPSTIKD